MNNFIRTILGASGLCLVIGACQGTLSVDGGGGSSVDGGAADELWTGNGPGCPAQPPAQLADCGAASEGQICAYFWKDQASAQDFYQACGCREASGGAKKWDCYDGYGGFLSCPATEPAPGSSCFGYVGGFCHYPVRTQCLCPSEGSDSAWDCTETITPTPDPPTNVDTSKLIKNLSPAERQTWCEWYVSAPRPEGAPQPPETPLSADGYTTNTGWSQGSNFFCQGCMPDVPVSYCVGNLSLSTCEAPLTELDDCVLTLFGACWPYEHGCARYLDKPGCSGTIVVGTDPTSDAGSGPGPAFCSLKVQ